MEMSYAQMVDGSRRHDPAAQRALYDELAPMAMGICVRYAPDRDQARDLLQDGFVKIYEKLGTLRNPQKLRSWAYNVMVNTCIQSYRRRRNLLPLDDLDASDDGEPLPPYSMDEMLAAIQRLSPGQRLVFNLCCIEECSYDEAALKLRCSNVNVRALLCKARRNLRSILEQTH